MPNPRFNAGDMVIVLPRKEGDGDGPGWDDAMDDTVGRLFKITLVGHALDRDDGFGRHHDYYLATRGAVGCDFWYAERWLAPVDLDSYCDCELCQLRRAM